MAKTKAELEDDCIQYAEMMQKAREAHQAGDFVAAISAAAAAWEFVDGMLQFTRRYGGVESVKSIEAIDYVLRYGPVFFQAGYFEVLIGLLKSQRRIEKTTSVRIVDELAKARSMMQEAYRLWSHLASANQVRQDELRRTLGGDQDCWRWIAETWEKAGVIQRMPEGNSYRLQMRTKMSEEIRAKCPSCGAIGKAAKLRLLDAITCPKCKAQNHFVFLATTPS